MLNIFKLVIIFDITMTPIKSLLLLVITGK